MKYSIDNTSQFKRDLQLAKRKGKDLTKLHEVVAMLADDIALPEKYRDHPLKGNYKGCRDCHIEPDWVLIYKKQSDILVLMLTRIGTHADLFN